MLQNVHGISISETGGKSGIQRLTRCTCFVPSHSGIKSNGYRLLKTRDRLWKKSELEVGKDEIKNQTLLPIFTLT